MLKPKSFSKVFRDDIKCMYIDNYLFAKVFWFWKNVFYLTNERIRRAKDGISNEHGRVDEYRNKTIIFVHMDQRIKYVNRLEITYGWWQEKTKGYVKNNVRESGENDSANLKSTCVKLKEDQVRYTEDHHIELDLGQSKKIIEKH